MRVFSLPLLSRSILFLLAVSSIGLQAHAQITEIIDATGDPGVNALDGPKEVAVDGSGNVYVTGQISDNAFKIATPGACSTGGTACVITEIINSAGDGGNALNDPAGVAVDGSDNVFVVGFSSDNAFQITSVGVITEIIDATGDPGVDALDAPIGVAVDGSGNVYLSGFNSNNAFKIATPGTCSTSGTACVITEFIDSAGDGGGNVLDEPWGVAVDGSGNVFVAAFNSDNVFQITSVGVITEIIDATGDPGVDALDGPVGVAVDGSGNVYVAGSFSDNAFKIATPGTCSTGGTPCDITEIIDSAGDGNTLDQTFGVAVDGSGNVYVTGQLSDNAFKIATPGTCSTSGTVCVITEIISSAGDGGSNTFDRVEGIAVDGSGNVYVIGQTSDNAFKISPASLPVELTAFDALVNGDQVVLAWSTASEANNAGFSVELEVGSDVFSEIGYVEGHGTTDETKEYSYAVSDLVPGLHRFRLKQIDFDGAFEYSSVVEAAITVPDRFLIEPAYPNPFNPTTTLRFAVAAEQHVEVTLVNAAGQSIRTLYSGTVAANEMQLLRVDADALPSGTYLVHFEGNGLSATKRIVLAK